MSDVLLLLLLFPARLVIRRVTRFSVPLIPNTQLSLSEKPVCLMFGRIEPYKGIEEVVDFWNTVRPEAALWIVGNDNGDGYVAALLERITDNPSIRTVFRHVPDRELAA